MQPAVPHIGALTDGKATVGSCLHSMPDTADKVTTALGTLFITLSEEEKTQLLLHHNLGDNTDDVTKIPSIVYCVQSIALVYVIKYITYW